MKIKELIAILQEYPENANVYIENGTEINEASGSYSDKDGVVIYG